MLEFLSRNPHYLVVVALCIFIVFRVIISTLKDYRDKNDDDDDGGIHNSEDPILDLPPGVILPQDTKELV